MARIGTGLAAALVVGMSALVATPPHALAAQSGGGAFGAGNGPIDISADELEVIDAENRAIWKGNVEAVQGTNRMRAPSLNVVFARSGSAAPAANPGAPGAGWGAIQRMEAEGPVYYVTPQQNARGDRAVYEAATNSITMTGNVVLVQDKNVVQGDRLVIDTKTNHSTLTSTARGRGNTRVRGVFYPSQNGGQAQSAPAGRP
jgi:lipopolysaccharide export system protein LptA